MRFDTSQAVLGNSDDEEDPVRRDGDGTVAEEQESPPPVKKKIPAAGSAVPDAWAKWAALCDPAPAEFLADEFGDAGDGEGAQPFACRLPVKAQDIVSYLLDGLDISAKPGKHYPKELLSRSVPSGLAMGKVGQWEGLSQLSYAVIRSDEVERDLGIYGVTLESQQRQALNTGRPWSLLPLNVGKRYSSYANRWWVPVVEGRRLVSLKEVKLSLVSPAHLGTPLLRRRKKNRGGIRWILWDLVFPEHMMGERKSGKYPLACLMEFSWLSGMEMKPWPQPEISRPRPSVKEKVAKAMERTGGFAAAVEDVLGSDPLAAGSTNAVSYGAVRKMRMTGMRGGVGEDSQSVYTRMKGRRVRPLFVREEVDRVLSCMSDLVLGSQLHSDADRDVGWLLGLRWVGC